VYSFYSKLQSDLKTTKLEETKIALEVCYKEIQRLRSEKLAPASTKTSTPRYVQVGRFLMLLHGRTHTAYLQWRF